MNYPSIGVFKTDQPLQLKPMPNGGWVVSQGPADPGFMATDLGAYSSAQDMIQVLGDALVNGPQGETT